MLSTCPGCGEKSDVFHDHHVVPKSVGGLDLPSNIVTICVQCHEKIHSRHRMATSELTRAGLKKALERGVVLGRPKVQAPDELILGMLSRGTTIRKAAAELNSMGYKISRNTIHRRFQELQSSAELDRGAQGG